MSDTELVVVTEEIQIPIVTETVETITIESTQTNTVVSTNTDNLVTNTEVYNVLVETQVPTIVAAGQPGPAGPMGLSEDAMAYGKQTDFVGDNIIYKGEAEAGSSFASPAWRIRKIIMTGDDVSEIWADGNTNFDNIWDNRLSLLYS